MNVLISGLPKTVNVNGSPFFIKQNFSVWIAFTKLMLDKNIPFYEKMLRSIQLCFYKDNIPPHKKNQDVYSAFMAIMWFYTMGEETNENNDKKVNKDNPRIRQKPLKILDYDYDQEYIVGAFQQLYGIDLTVENIHWWRFKMLLNSLTKETKLVEIMGYRAMDINPKWDESHKNFYKKMKILYALPDNRTEEEKERDFQEQLNIALGGG